MTEPIHTHHPLFVSYTPHNLQNPSKVLIKVPCSPIHVHENPARHSPISFIPLIYPPFPIPRARILISWGSLYNMIRDTEQMKRIMQIMRKVGLRLDVFLGIQVPIKLNWIPFLSSALPCSWMQAVRTWEFPLSIGQPHLIDEVSCEVYVAAS